ncbi:MAG: SLBB domain-containing protein [bacterium]
MNFKVYIIIVLLILLSFFTSILDAQVTSSFQNNPVSQTEGLEIPITDDYMLGPGDRLMISINGKVVNESYELIVSADGNILIPTIGPIYVADISIKALKEKLGRIIPKYYKDAQFSLIFLSPRTFKVFVTGQVVSPGTVTVRALTRLQEALTMAGGVLPNGSYRYIQITRVKDNKKIIFTVDLYRFYKKGDTSSNPYLEAGDVIYVPVMKESVKILGQVRSPGEYEIRSGDKLKDIIEMAGGLTPNASLIGGIVERSSGEIIDLDSLKLSQITPMSGDTIRIPERVDRVYVLGQVKNPGSITLVQEEGRTPQGEAISGQAREGSRVSELIARAGGVLPIASTRNIKVLRGGKEIATIDLYRILILGDTSQELSIRLIDGDIIFVPPIEKTVKILGEVRDPGLYEIREGDRVRDIIIRAGGLTVKSERSLGHIERIVNDKKEDIQFNISSAIIGDELQNPLVKDGDTIIIPELRRLVYVLGQVSSPGAFEYKEGRRLTEYVSLAGGAKDRADLKKMVIIRQTDDKSQVIPVNYEDIVSKGKGNLDIELKEGDIVYIPEVFFKGWQDLTQILMSIGILKSTLGPLLGW